MTASRHGLYSRHRKRRRGWRRVPLPFSENHPSGGCQVEPFDATSDSANRPPGPQSRTGSANVKGGRRAALSFCLCAYAAAMALFVARENVRKRLAPLEGEPGRTTYADGAARIEAAG